MKKILAVLFVVCMLFAMAVPAMAATYPSVSGQEEIKVTVSSSDTSKGTAEKTVLSNGDVKAVATVVQGEKFYGWTITGAAYTIISGSLTSPELVIRATGDVQMVANFTEIPAKPGDTSTQSPQSNDNAYLGLYAAFAVIALAGAAIVVTKKRVFSK